MADEQPGQAIESIRGLLFGEAAPSRIEVTASTGANEDSVTGGRVPSSGMTYWMGQPGGPGRVGDGTEVVLPSPADRGHLDLG